MKSLWFCILELVLFLVCLSVAFDDKTESIRKGGREEPLDLEEQLNRLRRDIVAAESGLYESEVTLGQGNMNAKDKSKDKGNRNRHPKNANGFNSRKRCFLGSPHGCFSAFADPLLDWPSPWGWPPGPLYPEYGPNFHPNWVGHGGSFGYNHCGCGGTWRGPGCSRGCNNHGWCCCGGGGGGEPANDCPQCNDAACKVPPTTQRPNQPGHPPLLQPFLGKQGNIKAPLQIKPGKIARRGYKRFDVPYNTGYQYPSGNYPSQQPSYGNYPYQTGYGNQYPYQSSYGSDPYQSSSAPYQSSCGTPPCPTPQQTPLADQIVGSLFLFKPNANFLADQKPNRKSEN